MSTTIMANPITTGTRRLTTLGSVWGVPMTLGASSDIISGMIGEGYDPGVVTNLSTAGATDAQLQSLWDTYNAGTQQFAVAANQLMSQLSGGPGGAASSPSYPQAAVPTQISTAFGIYDLAQQSSWDAIAGQFTSTQQILTSLASRAPKDPDVVQLVTEFNATVNKYAGYYNSVFGSDPSPMPLVTLGVAPLIIGAAVVVAIAAILGTLYLLNQRIVAKAQALQAQASVTSTQAQAAAAAAAQQQASNLNAQAQSLISQANSLPASQTQQKAALAAQAATLQQQANQLLNAAATTVASGGVQPPGATNWNLWFQQNFGLVIGALIAIAIVPPLLKRR